MLLCDALVALTCTKVLDYNRSGNTSAALLCQLLATHVISVSGLHSLALNRHPCITPCPGDTMKPVGLTHQSHTMATAPPPTACAAQSDRFLPVRQSLSSLPQPTSSHMLSARVGFLRPTTRLFFFPNVWRAAYSTADLPIAPSLSGTRFHYPLKRPAWPLRFHRLQGHCSTNLPVA